MDPRLHQRDVGEKEHYPPQEAPSARGAVRRGSAEHRRAQAKADKQNKNRHDQTARAVVEAHRTLAAAAARRAGATGVRPRRPA
jgi:hypothetical protein